MPGCNRNIERAASFQALHTPESPCMTSRGLRCCAIGEDHVVSLSVSCTKFGFDPMFPLDI